MSRNIPYIAFAALAASSLLAGSSARAEAPEGVKPHVMVLLDTSGSMEYVGGGGEAGQAFHVPNCEPEGQNSPQKFEPGTYPKSRLIAAMELLTGTIEDYWCRYDDRDDDPQRIDYQYPTPHAQPCSANDGGGCRPVRRNFDGLTDIFRDRIKFTLMTLDSEESSAESASGMWSYGPDRGGGVNLGARNDRWGVPDQPNEWDADSRSWSFADPDRQRNNRGQLLPMPSGDDFTALRRQNRWLQYEINHTIGYGGTPLAPLLDDAKWFLENDPAVRPVPSGGGDGDRFASCRERIAILITDGRPNQGEGEDGYPTTPEAVRNLEEMSPQPVSVYVVGFNLKEQDESDIRALDPDNGGPASEVYMVDTVHGLTESLSAVLSTALDAEGELRGAAFTNATGSNQDLQYQFTGASRPDPDNPRNLVGKLNQIVFRCTEECASVGDGNLSCARDLVKLHDRLDERDNDSRSFKASFNASVQPLRPELVDQAATKQEMAELFGVPQSGWLPRVLPPDDAPGNSGSNPGAGNPGAGNPGGGNDDEDDPDEPSDDLLGPAGATATQRQYMRQLIEHVRADDGTFREGAHMGGLTAGEGVVQEPLSKGSLPLPSWNEYVTNDQGLATQTDYDPECRPTVLYAGTHDGLIHAFRVDNRQGDGTCAEQVPEQDDDELGRELWTLMPHHLLRRSHELVGRYSHLMEGRMRVDDVLLDRAEASSENASRWRSVLTTGYGDGGRGYIAVDVTNALNGPRVMWEISARRHCRDGSCNEPSEGAEYDFSKLGLTTGRPAYGTAFIDGEEVAIAILSGGAAPGETSSTEVGRAVYVVNLETGERIAELSNDEGDIVDMAGDATTLESPMVGSPMVYPSTPGVVSTRAFVGDAGGRLWRLDMSAGAPDDWQLQLFHDPYVDDALADELSEGRKPVLEAPTVALESASGRLTVVYGLGQRDFSVRRSESRSAVISLSEVRTPEGGFGVEENWTEIFEPEEQLVSDPVIFAKGAYFTTFRIDSSDACSPGEGRLYGLHFTRTQGEDNEPKPALDEDGDPTTQDLVASVTLGEAVPGDVQVVQRPTCVPETPSSGGGDGGSSGGGGQRLVVSMGSGAESSPQTVPPDSSSEHMGAGSKSRSVSQEGMETIQSSAWGHVLY